MTRTLAVNTQKWHIKPPTTTAKGKKSVVEKGKCFYCSGDGHWKRNCPKYLVDKKAGKENQGKYDLMVLETCIVENNDSTWILDSEATNHVLIFKKLVPGNN